MNNKLNNMFYIGSCRYQPLFANYFPPRLHSTKEIIYFLENYKNIDINHPDIDYIYADLLHPGLLDDSINFIKQVKNGDIFENINTLVLEICSRKVCIINDVIYSDYKNNRTYPSTALSYDDMYADLIHIKNLTKQLNIQNIIILSHVSLPLKKNNQVIADRENLCNELESLCNRLDIKFINPGKLYNLNNSYTLEDILPDTIHYENDVYLSLILKQLKEYNEF
jgi:hypothetical protein